MYDILKKNIIFFVFFLLIFGFFLFFWKYHVKIDKTNLKPLKYEEIIKKINTKNSKNLIEVENFIVNNENIYGTLVALKLAKEYVLKDKLDAAFAQLNNSLKYTKEDILKNILKLRMAKIKIEKSNNEEAMNILKNIKNYNWNNIVENMKGDIFINNNKKKEAIKSWEKSLSIEESNASKEFINMKMNEIKEN